MSEVSQLGRRGACLGVMSHESVLLTIVTVWSRIPPVPAPMPGGLCPPPHVSEGSFQGLVQFRRFVSLMLRGFDPPEAALYRRPQGF